MKNRNFSRLVKDNLKQFYVSINNRKPIRNSYGPHDIPASPDVIYFDEANLLAVKLKQTYYCPFKCHGLIAYIFAI